MAIRNVNDLTKAPSISGGEKIPISDTEYIDVNQIKSHATHNLPIPTKNSDLVNDSLFTTLAAVLGQVYKKSETLSQTEITSAISSALAELVGSAPETLDTLKELADAITGNADLITALNNAIGLKLSKTEAASLYVALQDYIAYSTIEKNKLAGIQEGANKTILDTTPTSNSANGVTSGGVKSYIDNHAIQLDNTPTSGSANGVTSGGVRAALDGIISNGDSMVEVLQSTGNSAAAVMSQAAVTNRFANPQMGDGNSTTGNYTSVFGHNNTISGYKASAFGCKNEISDHGSSAFGYRNTVSDEGASAVGYCNTVSSFYASAFGFHNTASGYYSSAFGSRNITSGFYKSSAFGYTNTASGAESSAFGYKNTASGAESSAFGYNNTALGYRSSTFGWGNIARTGDRSVAIGYQSHAFGGDSMAIGHYATASNLRSMAIGYYVSTTKSHQIVLGSSGAYNYEGIDQCVTIANLASTTATATRAIGVSPDGTLVII